MQRAVRAAGRELVRRAGQEYRRQAPAEMHTTSQQRCACAWPSVDVSCQGHHSNTAAWPVQELDPEVMAALPEDIRRELRQAQMEHSSRAARGKPAREPPKPAKGPAGKRARKGGTNSQITSFYAKAKPA